MNNYNFCGKCGNKIKSNSKYCEKCGNKVVLDNKTIKKSRSKTKENSDDDEKVVDSRFVNSNSDNIKKGKKLSSIKVILILLLVLFLSCFVSILLLIVMVKNNQINFSYINENNAESDKKDDVIPDQDVETSFAEQTIYEDNGIIIKLVDSEKVLSGTKLKFYIENNSSLNLNFNAHSYGVNGIMTRNNIFDMECEVASGKKANTSLIIKDSILKKYKIDYIKYVDILFWAYDNDKSFKEFETNVIRIKSNKNDDSNSWITSGTEIYNKDGIKIDYLSMENDTIKYVLTNNTGNNLNITFNGISINDYTKTEIITDLYNQQVLKDNQIMFEIKVDNKFKENNSIDKINKVDFYLEYTINDDYNHYKTDNMTTLIK